MILWNVLILLNERLCFLGIKCFNLNFRGMSLDVTVKYLIKHKYYTCKSVYLQESNA